MRGRRWLLVAVVAVGAFAGAYALGADDDEDPPASDPQLDLSALPPGARELVSLTAAGDDAPHHAVYEGSDSSRLEVWTDGARAREETTLDDGSRSLVVRDADGSVRCEAEDEGGAWRCGERSDGVAGLEGRVDQLLADLEGATVTATDASIAGLEVRCFEVTSAEGAVTICLADDGVVARLVAGTSSIELVEADDDAPEDGFEPPDEA